MEKTLNRAVNVAVLVACAAIVLHLALYAYNTLAPPQLASAPYPKGSMIGDTPDLNLRSAGRTLVLVTASQCHYCQKSMPFYNRLTANAHRAGYRVVGLTAEDLNVHRDFLTKNGIYTDVVASSSKNNIRVRGTPTLIVVNSSGKVISSLEGAVDPAAEQAVEHALIPGA